MKAGWEVKPLGEVCLVDRGSSPRPIKNFITEDGSGVNWIKIGDTEVGGRYVSRTKQKITHEGALKSRAVVKGDFILTNSMTYGRPYIMATDGCIHDGWFVLRLSDNIDTDFFYYLLSSSLVQDQFENLSAGSVVRNISGDLVKKTILPIPPLEEQKRIVAVLDAAFEGLTRAKENAETNLQNARELFESIARTIFLLGEREWPKATLPKVCSDFGRGKSRHRPRNEPTLYGGDYPFLQTGDLSKATHYVREYSQTYSEKGLAQSKLWPAETVCIAIVGATIGESAITAMAACFPDSVIGMVPDRTKALPAYVQYLLLFYKNDLKAAGEGSARDNINLATFENWAFPIPSPSEQATVVAKLNIAAEQSGNLESLYRTKLTDIADLRQSLLQKAFAGELT